VVEGSKAFIPELNWKLGMIPGGGVGGSTAKAQVEDIVPRTVYSNQATLRAAISADILASGGAAVVLVGSVANDYSTSAPWTLPLLAVGAADIGQTSCVFEGSSTVVASWPQGFEGGDVVVTVLCENAPFRAAEKTVASWEKFYKFVFGQGKGSAAMMLPPSGTIIVCYITAVMVKITGRRQRLEITVP
jgi:hypothetical protein